jgi:hypothetical protein
MDGRAGVSPDRDGLDPAEQFMLVRIYNDTHAKVVVQECLSMES